MYPASADFHAAVANNEPQLALLVFDDMIFSDSDIRVDNGIQFDDYFNTEEDIEIGQALSNEIRFSLFNDDRLLNDYGFGEFKAYLGVRIGTGTYDWTRKDVVVYNGSTKWTWTGSTETPKLKRGSSNVSSQPTFTVTNMAVYDGKVYVFGETVTIVDEEEITTKYYKVYNADGTVSNTTINSFMQHKMWKDRYRDFGFEIYPYTGGDGTTGGNSIKMRIFLEGSSETYEFVPLGVFNADRPDSPDQIEVGIQCNDRMMKFDKDMPSNATLSISFPTTIGTLFEKLCTYVNVPYKTSTFINSDATISKRPEEFDNATCRKVIGWIAEAACANAGFDRDGKLVMKWLNSTNVVIDETGYADCVPVWYTVKSPNKIVCRNTSGGSDKTATTGNADVAYLIQDNPLLKNATT